MSEIDKIIAWNKEQREHEQIVQRLVLTFCHDIMQHAIEHDTSKWGRLEYTAFLASHSSLVSAVTGFDEEYQKHLKGDAIQSHIQENPHHAEYWDKRGERMPVVHVVSMFFDWMSRSVQKGTGLDGFWEYNLAKLTNQPHAVPIVEQLREDFAEALRDD